MTAAACLVFLQAATFVHAPTSAYSHMRIEGYSVYVSPAALAHPDETNPALEMLRDELREVDSIVPKKALPTLKKVAFWIEYNNPDFPCACYHVDSGWLKEHGYNPNKVRSVEIANPKNFVAWIKLNQPLMVLHELAHAYHDIEFGYDDKYIAACHKRALASGQYESVAHNRGGTRRHYALNNPMEYFAEMTEAYFGENDFYPFNRAQLKEYDPWGYEMVRRMWRVED